MTDIKKHPLVKQCSELCRAIEMCRGSEITVAASKAENLMRDIEAYVDSHAQNAKIELESSGDRGSMVPKSHFHDYGCGIVAFGEALKNSHATIDELVNLSINCGLEMQFRFVPRGDE